MNKVISGFASAKHELMKYFGCPDDYHAKLLTGLEWRVSEMDGVEFLCYWTAERGRADAVVATKAGKPIIYRKRDYTMVVAIDCIKIAFVLDNSLEVPEGGDTR